MWRSLLLVVFCHAGLAAALDLSPDEAVGKRIYLHGASSGNGALSARVGAADILVPASVVPCANCHGADGRGRPEGGVRPPDITWRRLTTPYGQRQATGRSHPPYDAAGLARAVTEGRDPAGNRLDPAMPRFVLSQRDLARLTAYLKRLEGDRDPGVQETELRIGTLLPTHGPFSALGKTVEAVLQGAFERINQQGGVHGRALRLVVADPGGDLASAQAALQRLIGQEQVFALVAPLVPALDGRFSALVEQAGIPLVGPLAFDVFEEHSPLVFTPLPGLREQLFALAGYASSDLGLSESVALVAFPDQQAQRELAQTLASHLIGQGWAQVRLLGYQPGHMGKDLEQVARNAQAVFFLGHSDAFASLAEQLQQADMTPYLFAASVQVASAALGLPPRFSGRLFLAYPFVPTDWTPSGTAALMAIRERSGLGGQHALIQVSAYSAALLLSEGLKGAGRDLSRQKLVTAMEGLHGFRTGLTPALSFGPGQRIGSAGAHIVTVDLRGRNFRPLGRFVTVDLAPWEGNP